MNLGHRLCRRMSLSTIVRLPLFELEPPARIAQLWSDFHTPQEKYVATHLSDDEFKFIEKRSAMSPSFVLPLYRGTKFFLFLDCGHDSAQVRGLSCYFRSGTKRN